LKSSFIRIAETVVLHRRSVDKCSPEVSISVVKCRWAKCGEVYQSVAG